MTSMYQVSVRGKVVETVTPKKKKVRRWFYIDIQKALDPSVGREDAIIGVPEDRVVKTEFGRGTVLDVSSPAKEYAALMYPVSQVFDWTSGKTALMNTGAATATKRCAKRFGHSRTKFLRTSSIIESR
jgi:hypothetical protein